MKKGLWFGNGVSINFAKEFYAIEKMKENIILSFNFLFKILIKNWNDSTKDKWFKEIFTYIDKSKKWNEEIFWIIMQKTMSNYVYIFKRKYNYIWCFRFTWIF